MKSFAFLCGGIEPPPGNADLRRVEMDVQGQRTVNLRIADISRTMVQNLPDLMLDLLEIAAYIHCGDQRASRGGETLSGAGRDWRREMRFTIPVRNPEIWSGANLRETLEETLGFLSDDLYEFEFVGATRPFAEAAMYFPDLAEGGFEADEVVLFSGGLDSLAGAIDSIVVNEQRTVLVSHHSADKTLAVQKDLVDELRRARHGKALLHVPVNVTNAHVQPVETTQRSRSFLFASLAFVIARMFERDRFAFYENGTVSLNLPIARDVLGSRATRTTHPRVIRGFERIFSMLAEATVRIDTPYLWLTKTEVVERIVGAGFGPLIAKSVSCVHPILWTRDVRHCGCCSQCIDRRFAVLAADAEPFDPTEGYAIDLLTGPRDSDQDLRLAVAYVKFWQEISKSSRERFPVEHPEVYSVIRHLPGLSADTVLDRIWDLHLRQAESVQNVIEAGLRAHVQALVRDELPRGALLRLCFSRDRIEPQPLADPSAQVNEFLDRLPQPVCDFAVDEKAGRIRFRGGFSLAGADYELVAALLPRFREAKSRCEEISPFYPPELAEALGIEEQSLRARITRLRKAVEERLAIDQGIVLPKGFIENLHGKGYRLSPELREVAPGDLDPPRSQMSQTA